MFGSIRLEVYTSIFITTEEKHKFDFYTDNCDEYSSAKLKYELHVIFNNSDITPKHLQHERIGPPNIQA